MASTLCWLFGWSLNGRPCWDQTVVASIVLWALCGEHSPGPGGRKANAVLTASGIVVHSPSLAKLTTHPPMSQSKSCPPLQSTYSLCLRTMHFFHAIKQTPLFTMAPQCAFVALESVYHEKGGSGAFLPAFRPTGLCVFFFSDACSSTSSLPSRELVCPSHRYCVSPLVIGSCRQVLCIPPPS